VLNEEEKNSLKHFIQWFIENLLPLDEQECQRDGDHFWCEDWKTIEIVKCLFLGKETYLSDPPPRRLKGNPFFKMDEIVKEADKKLRMLKKLKKTKDSSDILLVKNVRRGTDIMLASFVKRWKIIYCHDPNPVYEKTLDYFRMKFDMDIVFKKYKGEGIRI